MCIQCRMCPRKFNEHYFPTLDHFYILVEAFSLLWITNIKCIKWEVLKIVWFSRDICNKFYTQIQILLKKHQKLQGEDKNTTSCMWKCFHYFFKCDWKQIFKIWIFLSGVMKLNPAALYWWMNTGKWHWTVLYCPEMSKMQKSVQRAQRVKVKNENQHQYHRNREDLRLERETFKSAQYWPNSAPLEVWLN